MSTRTRWSWALVPALLLACLSLASTAAAGSDRGHDRRTLGWQVPVAPHCDGPRGRFSNRSCSPGALDHTAIAPLLVQLDALAPLDRADRGNGWPRRRGRASLRCTLAVRWDVRTLLKARLRNRDAARSHTWTERFCDGLAVSHRGLPLGREIASTCSHVVDASRRIDGAELGACVRSRASNLIAEAGFGPPIPRPNIIVILADDQRADTIDATHGPLPEVGLPAMPATWSRLAGEGLTFTHTVVTTSICGPSRGSFFTGRHTHRHGMLRNAGPTGPAAFEDADTFATRFDDAGYRTGFLGKYSNGFALLRDEATGEPVRPPGWDDFRVFDHVQSVPQTGFSMLENGELVHYGAAPDDDPDVDTAPYATDVLARQALDFIEASTEDAPSEPFALWISTSTPHHPWQPAARHAGAFDAYQPVSFPNTWEADVSDKPVWIQALAPTADLGKLGQLFLTRAQLEMQLSTDEMVASLVDRLDELGVGDDTIVVYTSDNGQAWGEHHWFSKGCPWESCLRVPMLLRYPRWVAGPREVGGLAANVDVTPTLLELAGVAPPDDVDGLALGDVVRHAAPMPERDVLFEAYGGPDLTYAGVHDGSLKYLVYESGGEALYDLVTDPFELENALDDPELEAELEAMRDRLDELWPGFEAVAH